MSTEIVAKKTSKTGSIAGNWEEISRNYAIPIFLGLLSREAIKASILLLYETLTKGKNTIWEGYPEKTITGE